MPRLHELRWIRVFSIVLILTALGTTGCLPVVVGGLVAAGGAAGYAYYAGEYKREYEAGAAEVRYAADRPSRTRAWSSWKNTATRRAVGSLARQPRGIA